MVQEVANQTGDNKAGQPSARGIDVHSIRNELTLIKSYIEALGQRPGNELEALIQKYNAHVLESISRIEGKLSWPKQSPTQGSDIQDCIHNELTLIKSYIEALGHRPDNELEALVRKHNGGVLDAIGKFEARLRQEGE